MAHVDGTGLRLNCEQWEADASMLRAVDLWPGRSLTGGTRQKLRSIQDGASELPRFPPQVRMKNGVRQINNQETFRLLLRREMGKVRIRVKNTFIHVEDEDEGTAIPLRRIKSDTQFDGPAAPWRVGLEGLHHAGGAASSAHDTKATFATVLRCQDVKSWNRHSASKQVHHGSSDRVPNASSLAHDMDGSRARPQTSSASAENETSDIDEQGQNDQVARESWSVGSAQHDAGRCKPCSFYADKVCAKGLACRFCHASHPRRTRIRPNKAKRNQCKQIAAMLDSLCTGNRQEAEEELRRQCLENAVNVSDTAYLLRILRFKLNSSSTLSAA